MSTPEPSITGDLERTPFLHALLSLQNRRANGTLAVWPESGRGQDRLYLKDGTPVAGRFLDPLVTLLDRAMLPLFARPRGPFAFYEDVDLVGDEALRGKVDVLTIATAALRAGVREDAMEAVLAQYDGQNLRVAQGTDFRRYGLNPKEERLVEVARSGANSVQELVDACEAGPTMGRRLVYLWIASRALAPYVSTTPPAGNRVSRPPQSSPPRGTPISGMPGSRTAPSTASSSGGMPAVRTTVPPTQSVPPKASASEPPAGLSADALAYFVEAKQRLKALDTQTYFDMLGVPRDAGPDAVRKQFIQLAKRWHPDRLPAELAALRPEIEHLFHLLNGAHDTLVDEQKRANYVRNVQDGGGTPAADRKLAAVVTAAMDQQKAEVLMKRRDFAGARPLLEQALSVSPDDADLNTSYAWALMNVENSGPLLPDIVRHLDRAIALSPKHDRAHFYRGLALRRLDRESDAIASFKRAADANPRNLDAAREVRIAQMRGQLAKEAPKETKDDSLFSKLFGSSKKKP